MVELNIKNSDFFSLNINNINKFIICYTSESISHIYFFDNDLTYVKSIKKVDRSSITSIFTTQIDNLQREGWLASDNSLQLNINIKDVTRPYIEINTIRFDPVVINNIEHNIENGGYLQEFHISRNRLVKVLENSEVSEVMFSLSSDLLIVNGEELKVSNRHSLSLSFTLNKDRIVDAINFTDGNVIKIAIPSEEIPEQMIIRGESDYCILPLQGGSFRDRIGIKDESHKQGNFAKPLIKDKKSKPLKINRPK